MNIPIERKTPSKNIVEFLKYFSSISIPKLFFVPHCIIYKYENYNVYFIQTETRLEGKEEEEPSWNHEKTQVRIRDKIT